MKKLIKIICVLLACVSVAGCSKLPEFDYSTIVHTITEVFSGKFSNVTQTEVIVTEESFDISCYSRLNETQQRIYRFLLTVSEKMVSGWIRLGDCGKDYNDNISVAYRAMTSDYPQIFWMPSTYLLKNIGTASRSNVLIAFDYKSGENSCSYTVSKKQRDAMREELETEVARVSERAKQCKSIFETELFLHDYICQKATYKTEGDALIYTSYGALVSGEAVCEGYSRAMQLLCEELSIPCILVYGKSEGMGHMWNLINPGSGWYHVDATWNDAEELIHTYFNMTDAEISRDHEIWQLYTADSGDLPSEEEGYNLIKYECNSAEDGYFNRLGYTIDKSYTSAAKAINEKNKIGQKTIQLKVINPELAAEFEKDYNRPISHLQARLQLIGSSVELKSIAVNGDIITLYW